MTSEERPLIWIGSSKKELVALPIKVRKFFGHALYFAQCGDRHEAAKVLKGFGGAGVLELIEDDAGGTYAPFTPSSSRRPYSSCTASRRRARAASPCRKRTLRSSGLD